MSEPPALPPSDPGFLRRHALMLLSAAALTVLLVIFIVLNDEVVTVDLIGATAELRLAWALLIAAAGGFLIGVILPRLRRG
ncbi:MAG: putative integral membrane protein [Chloroflexi bacterium]|nr:MAG: putative integral membrane protein [Chloroflexota bacterium]